MNNIDFTIRNYNTHDLEAIAEIEKLCFSSPWSLNALNDFIKFPHNRILVATTNNTVVGYITHTCIFDEIQIANVATHPKFRKQGIAFALIENLINSNNNGDVAIITLEVRQSNIPAQNLYTKCNFDVAGTRKNYYSSPTEDAILMNFTFERDF